MNPLNLVSAFVVTYMCIVQGQTQCEGPCVVITECPHMFALINKPSRTPEELYQLRRAHCGHQGNYPKVCCVPPAQPDSRCFNPDGQPGQCIVVQSCPHLWKLVTEAQKYKENVDFLQNSICEGPAPYSVCCGPEQRPEIKPTGVCKPSAMPPDRRTECCGIDASQSNKIIGGNKTSVDQYPWLSIIEYRGINDNKIKLLCGGTLISSKYVLTAGHCVIGSVLNVGTPTNVRLGEYDTNNDGPDCDVVEGGGMDCTDGLVIIPIETTIPHPMYDPRSTLRRHDIALLRLKEFAPYTDFIRPICLPLGDITSRPSSDLKLYVAGWGAVDEKTSSSNIKLHVDLPFVTLMQCQKPFSVRNRNIALWKGQLCAGGEAGKDSCKGDSGGPLMREDSKIFEIVGIVSFGTTPCGIENVPGVYTKVHYYSNWIRSQMMP